MNQSRLRWMALTGALLMPAASYAQVSCTRESLQAATESYIDTQTQGARAASAAARREAVAAGTFLPRNGLPLMARVGYVENFDVGGERLIDKSLTIDHHRSLLDTVRCETFTEAIVSDKGGPYALGTRLRMNRGSIAEIEMMWTTNGYWGFDVEHYLKTAATEDWGPIPVGNRDTRETLESVANAYMDALLEGKATVEPWGFACTSTAPDGSCQVGTPVPAVNIGNRHLVVDETIGAVVVLCTFGAEPASGRIRTADAHLFRVENGKVRFVHALTHLLQADVR